MRNTLAVLCLLAASVAGFSQEKSFNLNHYKFPDYKRHELELNFNSNGTYHKATSNYISATGEMDKRDNLMSNNSSLLTFGYQYDYLTRKRIDFLSSTLTGNYVYSKNTYYDQKEVKTNPSMQWNLNGSSKYYLIENKIFVEGLTNLNYSWNQQKRNVSGSSKLTTNLNYMDLSAGLSLGVGRIEKVSDLWQAYYILEKLNKQGSFNRPLAENDVFEFARLASRLKNKRFFDARLQKIEELTGLDSLLHQQGLIRESDISYFTTLNDYWSYGNFQDRFSGMELLLRATPHYTRFSNKEDDETAIVSHKSTVAVSGIFNYVKQLNLYWEQRIAANVSYESILDTTGSYFFDTPENIYTTNVFLGYGYFPDSRTSIYGSINYRGENILILNPQNIPEDSWVNRVFVNLSGDYYLSPQLQITGRVTYNYSDRDYNSSDRTYINYNLGLRYAIF